MLIADNNNSMVVAFLLCFCVLSYFGGFSVDKNSTANSAVGGGLGGLQLGRDFGGADDGESVRNCLVDVRS